MQKNIYILTLILLLLSFSIEKPEVFATYKKLNGAENSFIYLYKNGTFLTQLLGGCDGRFETKGNWKINKDTLNFTNIESRILDDPWKGSGMNCKYLIKKQTIISFSIIDSKIVLDSNDFYKKVKNK